ncbi:sigma-54-dependent Fis family transcriptional regulator [Peribacillus psychrosaccharolyticus]|uniref:Sigma-54-dependent Fis family transcriptional regulator n=1 Tax=Peribacillus psychrosaccharolyticus TaxID=1407 RepID=A0A974NNP1_PERPY|nr:sigma-54-dependent Fis family transcriptional regulator [Peribacillus psychrosaccharolyticus]MEC2054184.1 sigma-54-dependent Fis family transcriptional regulator [Peribacillus psychrosaccharolyticus]MED3742198.1 sigma-54-dependent Fis family transcriptional regulator [Peribacillus psychrosaccharolyticus]QQT01187.1 sigma-54-dependent Fis family transcriptional regulator [Peribacillus psychrosaccharolyticus]
MKKALYLGRNYIEWGSLETDKNGKLVSACQDFCAHFSINESDWLGVAIKEIVQKVDWYHRKNVFFGVVFGYSCLVRIIESNQHYVYRVIVREDEIDVSEMISFMNSIDTTKMKKRTLPKKLYSFEEIIGVSQTIDQVKELGARIATSNSTVLLTGESGTGKELFAQAIHGLSSRKNNPFVAVNCAAIPAELFESELFGYEGGAFSGAKKEGKPGKIELAQHGTLFLDEISELPYPAQGKLLRVLQEREIERLGGTDSKSVDIRIITATNRDLKVLVHEGKFRQDLFYRLFVFDLKIPSLRQRKEDILPLAYSFIDVFNEKLGREVRYIDFKLQEWLLEYDWPGNVRELKAYIERGMNIVEGDTLNLDSLTIQINPSIPAEKQSTSLKPLDEEVRNAEIKAIRRALTETKGDRTQAAQLLNIHIASLYRKISKYNLKD